jgi:hypothetical protein
MTVSYKQAVDAAIVLDYKGTNEAVVAGLNKIKPPGMTRDIITVDEFRNEWARQFAGSGKYGEITAGGNFVTGDTLGQDMLKTHWYNKTMLSGTDILFFLDMYDFFATDLANDSNSAFQVLDYDPGEADKNGIFELALKFAVNGRLATYTAHATTDVTSYDPTDIAFVSGSPDTITDANSLFVTAGFVAGQSLMIVGSTSNDAVHTTISSVAAGTLTLASTTTVTSEDGISGMELHGGAL